MPNDCELPSLSQMITYVQRNGWKRQSAGACCKVFLYSNDQDVSLTLPKSDKFIDYAYKLRNALEMLATAEGVSGSEIIGRIKGTAGAE